MSSSARGCSGQLVPVVVHVRVVRTSTCLRSMAAPALVVGLTAACARNHYQGDPTAPIDIKETGFGYRYSQAGHELNQDRVRRVLTRSQANLESEIQGYGAIVAMSVGFGTVGGALIGYPIGRQLAGDTYVPWFLALVGVGTVSVMLPIENRSDQRLLHAVRLHNANATTGDSAIVPPLRPLRSAWLARSVYGGGHTIVKETIPSFGESGRLSMSGPSLSYDWSLGYFVAPQLALSANLLGLTQLTSDADFGGDAVPNPTSAFLVYNAALVNVTYYVSPNYGLYALAGAGYGVESGESSRSVISPNAGGLALSLGLGYDFTIADSGALGVVVRGLHSPLHGDFSLPNNGSQRTPFTDRWSGVLLGLSLTYY